MLHRIFAIAKKEYRQLLRDTRMLFIIFFFPVFLLAVFGYAINFDVRYIKLAVLDEDKSTISKNFVKILTSSSYFDLVGYLNNDDKIKTVLNKKEAQAVIVFPNDFSQKLNSRRDVKIQILIDGVDGNTAAIIMNYLNAATRSYSMKIAKEYLTVTGRNYYVPIDLQPRFWFNPDLVSARFLIPGLMGMILILTAVISISLSIVREKERGTIEQINVSPISSAELMLGKTIPYVILSLMNAAIVLLAGYVLFGIVIKGSVLLLFLGTLAFLFAALGIGIFISTIADSQQVAFQAASVVSLLPSLILSGFIFPIESMPAAVQILTNITPAKFYIVILRAILLRGVGLEAFWDQILFLILFGGILLLVATAVNKKRRYSY
ncbi:MAG: ABC transporter permease [Bacteroidota bacterium]